MKKTLLALLMAVFAISANAQFDKGTHYANASVSGLGVSYGNSTWTFGLGGAYGYYVADSWMVLGNLDYTHVTGQNSFGLGVAGRYSWKRNGLYGQFGLQFEHASMGDASANYAQLTPEIGYTFYVNKYVAIEPAFYYHICVNDFEAGSRVGLKIGVGLYF